MGAADFGGRLRTIGEESGGVLWWRRSTIKLAFQETQACFTRSKNEHESAILVARGTAVVVRASRLCFPLLACDFYCNFINFVLLHC